MENENSVQLIESSVQVSEASAHEISAVCPDCGSPANGDYCHNCGEKIEPHLLSVRHYFREIFHEFLAFDSKFFRTLPALMFKPGFLSKEYVEGRRKKYLIPSRLYITIAVVSFFFLGYVINQEFETLFAATARSHGQNQFQFFDLRGEPGYRAAETMVHLVTEISPYVLLLISTPLFALFLKLFYWKQHKLYIEHLIFSFHFFAFALLVFSLSAVIPLLFRRFLIVDFLAILSFYVYLYLALRRFYEDRGRWLVLRTSLLSFSYWTIAAFAIVGTIVIAWTIGVQTGDLPRGGIGSFDVNQRTDSTGHVTLQFGARPKNGTSVVIPLGDSIHF